MITGSRYRELQTRKYQRYAIKDALYFTGVDAGDGRAFTQPFVYTFYDKDDAPLYVGKTISLMDRLDWHSRKEYWNKVRTIGLIPADFDDIDLIEIVEIKKKHPYFNRESNKDYSKKYIQILGVENPIEIIINYSEVIFLKRQICNMFGGQET